MQLKEILVYVKLVYVCMHECYVIRWLRWLVSRFSIAIEVLVLAYAAFAEHLQI